MLRTPFNRGYGGNQKLGYLHAIKQGFDYVVLLHGDGQYAPEYLPQIVNALGEDEPDALIASRMINRRDALRGGMPLYKWVGNQVLTAIENRMLGSDLSEFHSGYRAYKVDALRSIHFQLNSDDFHFDTEVLIQLLSTGRVVKEIPVPTFYGDEISRVNGLKYAVNCLKAVSKVRLGQAGLFYEPKFDFGSFDESGYRVKQADNTLHHEILSREWPPDWRVADLGSSRGVLSAQLAQEGRARDLRRRRAAAGCGRRRGDRARSRRRLRPHARPAPVRLRARARRARAPEAPRRKASARSPRS